jgi:hypothetical protein
MPERPFAFAACCRMPALGQGRCKVAGHHPSTPMRAEREPPTKACQPGRAERKAGQLLAYYRTIGSAAYVMRHRPVQTTGAISTRGEDFLLKRSAASPRGNAALIRLGDGATFLARPSQDFGITGGSGLLLGVGPFQPFEQPDGLTGLNRLERQRSCKIRFKKVQVSKRERAPIQTTAVDQSSWGSSDQRGDAIVCGLGERFSCQSRQLTAAGGSGWPGVVRRTQVSCGRDTRFASANSENAWAPFLAMPR